VSVAIFQSFIDFQTSFQQFLVDGPIRLIWWALRYRSWSQDPARQPVVPSASTLAPLPLVHFCVSKCKAERHKHQAGPESVRRLFNCDCHVCYGNYTVDHSSPSGCTPQYSSSLVDIFGSISNVATRLVCGFARVLLRLFIKRPSCCRTTSAEKHQETLSILCRLMLLGCKTYARMVSWLSRHHSR
jgi:hypothetical protein